MDSHVGDARDGFMCLQHEHDVVPSGRVQVQVPSLIASDHQGPGLDYVILFR